jgi:AraC-like DNA-binding protein
MLIEDGLFRRLVRSRDFLADSAAGSVTLADAAARAHLSRFYFLREFSRAFGYTPHEFLQQRRLAHARQLLAATNIPITEVCFEVGYGSLGSFSTLFRQATGYAPSEFRRRARPIFTIRWAERPVFIPSCYLEFYVPQFSRSELPLGSCKLWS